jgi:predicted HicB family RNase H-like nuclease
MAIDKAERNRQNAASRARYEAKTYSKLMLRIRHDGSDGMIKDDISRAAERDGLSVNAWILEAIRDKL